MEAAPRLLDFLNAEDAEHFAEVRGRLDAAGVAYEIDPTLVRGLDYYTRTVFEFTSDRLGAQSGVGGGGRYDGLVEQLGGPPTPGIGWAAGIERILLAGSPPHPAPAPVDLFVAYESSRDGGEPAHGHAPADAFALLVAARAAGLTAQMELAGRSLKGQLGYANALDARYVAILGGGETILKDMLGSSQETMAADAVVHAVLRGLRSL
jgi:histidyl-tRNA synthetase